MISFEQEIQNVVIKHGIAADSVNKDLVKVAMEMYLHGFRDCDFLNSEGIEYSMVEVTNKVMKSKERYEGSK